MRALPLTAGVLAGCLLTAFAAGPALAETIGGERLSSTHRTVDPGPDARDLPDVWAETWLLADATTGEILAAKGPHVKRAPASTLKTLTALTVIPQTSPQEVWTATPLAANADGSRVGLRPGKDYTLEQLWYAVFLPSANDAAIGVAQANGGVDKTIRQMNDVAARLQAFDTVAKTPNGLDRKGQTSSAYDLALIARAGMKLPDFATYAATEKAMFPDVKGKGKHPIYNTNRLLLSGFKGVTGVKTGFTTDAGRTYVGAATRGDRSLIVTLMGIHESSEDAARKLLRWGFKNHDKVTPIGTLVDPLPEGATSAGSTAQAGDAQPEQAGTGEAGSQTASATDGSSTQGDASAAAPTSTSSAIVYGAAFLVIVALVGAGLALTRSVLGRRRGRHATR